MGEENIDFYVRVTRLVISPKLEPFLFGNSYFEWKVFRNRKYNPDKKFEVIIKKR